MKKRLVALTLCMATAFAMIGCGNKNDNVEGTEAVENTEGTEVAALPEVDLAKYDLNPEEFVTLCDYSAIPVTLTGDYEVTEEDAIAYFEQYFTTYGPFYEADPSKTVIEEGDIVDVNYVGKLDGVAFDGGSAENQVIDVSGNCSVDGSSYIDGFTDGLLGATVGTEVDCDVTFPENYSNTDLAGKAVVFTFTINSIQKEVTLDDVDDAFALENFGAETTAAMYADIQSYLQDAAEDQKMSDIYTAVQDYLLANCTVDMPEDYYNDRYALESAEYQDTLVNYYGNGDESQLEEFLSQYYGVTLEEHMTEWEASFRENVELEFIIKALVAKEGIEFDQEGFDTYINNMVSYYGATSTDEFYEQYGYGDAAYGETYMKDIYVGNLALEQLAGNAVITVEEATEAVETTEAAE